MRIDLQHRLPASSLAGRVWIGPVAIGPVWIGRVADGALAEGRSIASSRVGEGLRSYRRCRPASSTAHQPAMGSIAPMSTFGLGLTKNGLDPEVSPA
jgi:hypothetical protein